jgi:PPM family protein phosphatase
MTLSLRYAARSDVGLVREGNEDSGYAGPHLLVIADGMGGHAAGEVASSVVVSTLASLDEDPPGGDLLDHLADAVQSANRQLADMTSTDPILEGMGTTVTAMLSVGPRVGLVHVGDSRAYLLRGGELQQVTRDHTFVQSLVDEGRISLEEADQHPQRNLVMRALDGREELDLDLSVREVTAGDRLLLCSDGLSGVVSADTLVETLGRGEPDEAVEALVELALRAGGPDNVTCVVADVVDNDTLTAGHPVVVGAATDEKPGRVRTGSFAASRAAALTPRGERRRDDEDEPPAGPAPGRLRRWLPPAFLFLLLALVVGGGGYLGWAWTQSQYYVGASDSHVAIFKGLDQSVAGLDLSRVHERDALPVSALPPFERERVENTISAASLGDAERIVGRLHSQACAAARVDAQPSPEPTPTATGTPSPRPTGDATPRPGSSGTPSPSPTPTPTPSVPGIDCADGEAAS